MARVELLKELKSFIEEAVAGIDLPVALQKGDTTADTRPAEVHLMRLPDSAAAKKVVPYILLQLVSGNDRQESGQRSDSSVTIRFIFATYSANEEEGAMMLLNLIERVRFMLLRKVVVGRRYALDVEKGLDTFIYADDTAPYYAGEMIGDFKLPAIEREVSLFG